MTGKRIGEKSIAAQIAEIKPGELKLFPVETYKSHDAVRQRAVEAMRDVAGSRFRTLSEPEGSYVLRLR